LEAFDAGPRAKSLVDPRPPVALPEVQRIAATGRPRPGVIEFRRLGSGRLADPGLMWPGGIRLACTLGGGSGRGLALCFGHRFPFRRAARIRARRFGRGVDPGLTYATLDGATTGGSRNDGIGNPA